ncbi:MAG: toll/interleukin-1 receptor domain-containing protein [Candidatus Hodarchaeales archaeon]|jgi:hypothetical protein
MKVFVSHSTKDMHIVEEFKKIIEPKVEVYVAAYNAQPGNVLWEKIETNIKNSNCVVAIMTRNGSRSEMVQQEIATAKAHKIPIVPIVEKGVDPKGALAGVEYLKLDKRHPDQALKDTSAYLRKLKKQADNKLIGSMVLVGLAIIMLSQFGE